MTRSSVSICMIVRNEEGNLRECLADVRRLVSELIVVDTGSTDQTRQIAAELGARVFDYKWNDSFADARNYSRGLAGGKWIFWLDADDRFDAANLQRLAALLSQLDSIAPGQQPLITFVWKSYCPGAKGDITMSHGRIFLNASDLLWTGRVHERLVHADGADRINIYASDVVVRHEGYEDFALFEQKQERDLRLLKLELADHPNEALPLFYIGRLLAFKQQQAEALEYFRRAIEADRNGQIVCTPSAYAMATTCLLELDRTADAVALARAGAERFPHDLTLQFQYGCVLRHIGQLDEAAKRLLGVINAPAPAYAPAGYRSGLQSEDARVMLGRVYQTQGLMQQAAEQFGAAAASQRICAETWFLFGQASLPLGRSSDVKQALARLDECSNASYFTCLLHGMASLADKQYEEAKRWGRAASAIDPQMLAPHILLCDVLYAEGVESERCIHICRGILQADPNQEEIRQRLAKLLSTYAPSSAPAVPPPARPPLMGVQA